MVFAMRLSGYISSVATAAFIALAAAAVPSSSQAADNALTQTAISVAQAAPVVQLADAATGPRRENGDMVIGADNAPITIIEYASLTCPHCARFHTETLPKLKSEYVETGKVKYVFRDFPLDGLALRAAAIAQCAGPERYFTFLDVFFQQQSNWTRGNDPEQMLASLKRLARTGGMSEAQIDDCLKNKQVQDSILASRMTGENQFNVRSTPTLVINGPTHPGALPFDELEKLLKPLLKS
jgi:protein-disulfide isomerase